jgi:NTE family protein
MGLCLSGGGYRAMLFHTGVLWRLNELRVLSQLKRISSVSGGSIAAARLGLAWKQLTWKDGVASDFAEGVVAPVRRLASETIDVKSVVAGVLLPWMSVNDQVVKAYRKHVYGDATLQDLPTDAEGPRFIVNATNVQSGVLVRFSRGYVADYRVGVVESPTVPLAVAVAASSAFPPPLSPARLSFPEGAMEPRRGVDLHREPYTTDMVLTDGGVYDNLGLETVWKRYKTVIVSDGGGQLRPDPDPKSDWLQHGLRVNALIDGQVRALRRRQVISSLIRKERSGVFWSIRGDIADYKAPNTLACPHDRTLALADTRTRLAKLDALVQERLINWGYAICDAGMRAWVDPTLAHPADFPYPAAKV